MVHLGVLFKVIVGAASGTAVFDRKFLYLVLALCVYMFPLKAFSAFWKVGANKIVDTNMMFANHLENSGFWHWYIPYTGLILTAAMVYVIIWRVRN